MAENHLWIKLTPKSTITSTVDMSSKSNDEEVVYDYCDYDDYYFNERCPMSHLTDAI